MGNDKKIPTTPSAGLIPSDSRIHLLILFVIGLIVLIIPAGVWDIRGPDEGRYTQVAKEILENNNWLTLTVLDEPYDQKPPLAFWFYAAALWANEGHVSAWHLRMPPILAAIGTVFLTYFMGRRFQNPQAGFLSGLILFATPLFLDDAPAVELNMLYTFFITATLFVYLMRNDLKAKFSTQEFLAFWGLLTCSFFVKGPVGILIVFSVPLFLAALEKQLKYFTATRPLPGFILLLGSMGFWFYAQKTTFGSEFVANQISGETVDRFLQGDHNEPFYYYFTRFFTTIFFPWIFLMIPALIAIGKNRAGEFRKYAVFLGWIIIPLIIFTIANGKRDSYLLPLLPAFALLTGTYFESHLQHLKLIKPLKIATAVLLALLTLAVAVAFVITILRPDFINNENIDPLKLNPPFWLSLIIAFAYLTWALIKKADTYLHLVLIAASVVFLTRMVDLYVVRGALNPRKSSRPFTEVLNKLLEMRGENIIATVPDLGTSEYHVYGTYHVKKTVDLESPEKLPGVLVVRPRQAESSGSLLLNLGYREYTKTKANKDNVVIFVKDKTDSNTETQNAEVNANAGL